MKRTYHAIITVASLLVMARGLSAQTSTEGRVFAKTWLHLDCFEAGTAQNEMQSFVKYKDELNFYFFYVT